MPPISAAAPELRPVAALPEQSASNLFPSADVPFRVEVDLRQHPAVLSLAGELDLAAAPLLTALLEELLEQTSYRLVVDVSGVSFIDCAGISPLLRAAAGCGGQLRLQGCSPALDRLLSALDGTGLGCPDLVNALTADRVGAVLSA